MGVFPSNIAQLTGLVDAFGIDIDTKSAVHLVFQTALWPAG